MNKRIQVSEDERTCECGRENRCLRKREQVSEEETTGE